MTMKEDQQRQRNAAYSRAVPHCIQGLYSFHAAVTILRIAHALGELDASVIDDVVQEANDDGSSTTTCQEEKINAFMDHLNVVERSLQQRDKEHQKLVMPSYAIVNNNNNTTDPRICSHLIVVEGLDGSGKSSLVQGLAEVFGRQTNTQAVAMTTPTQSMAGVRPVFDKRGGPVARAFYAVSNFVLQYEIQQLELQLLQQQQQREEESHNTTTRRLIVIVDRWYTSTVAYSCAWKNTTGPASSIEDIEDSSIFAWPENLMTPDLLLLLELDDSVRRQRVRSRQRQQQLQQEEDNKATKDDFNPWDQRLDEDPQLGERIMAAFERVAEQLVKKSSSLCQVIHLDASQSKEDVLSNAQRVIHDQLISKHPPIDPTEFRQSPLQLFRWVSSELGLCDLQTGRRHKHAPWALQISWNGEEKSSINKPPVLKTVGIHTVDSAGVLFFMQGEVDSEQARPASMICVVGEYPYEQQWRGEGMLVPFGWKECEFLQILPPPSLVACTTACSDHEEDADDSTKIKFSLTEEQATQLRQSAQEIRKRNQRLDINAEPILQGYRFVPLRMEILSGGPSSPGGPSRYEWLRGLKRPRNADINRNKKEKSQRFDPDNGWSQCFQILPFRPPSQPIIHLQWRPTTIAITGTHCSGKSTIAQKLAQILGATFHAELGDILRNRERLIAGGHRTGDGSGSIVTTTMASGQSWDDRVIAAEVARDKETTHDLRVVETWHIGNLAWSLFRLQNSNSNEDSVVARQEELWNTTKRALEDELNNRHVVAIHLSIGVNDILRRRQKSDAKKRIPMENEPDEVRELHQALEMNTHDHLMKFQEDTQNIFPLLVVENSDDDGLDDTVLRIVQFINEQQWRRAL